MQPLQRHRRRNLRPLNTLAGKTLMLQGELRLSVEGRMLRMGRSEKRFSRAALPLAPQPPLSSLKQLRPRYRGSQQVSS